MILRLLKAIWRFLTTPARWWRESGITTQRTIDHTELKGWYGDKFFTFSVNETTINGTLRDRLSPNNTEVLPTPDRIVSAHSDAVMNGFQFYKAGNAKREQRMSSKRRNRKLHK